METLDKSCLYLHEDGVGVKVYREDIPQWANWLAMDKNGAMYAYEDEPKLDEERAFGIPRQERNRKG